jgi:hypothetical protein
MRQQPVSGRIVRMAAINDAEFRGGAPKTEPQRNPALLAMARGQRCLLQVPGVCQPDPTTTVACHSNQSVHGKAGARKADDHWHVHGCAACHRWLDQARPRPPRRSSGSQPHTAGWSPSGKTSWRACGPARQERKPPPGGP